MPLSCCIQKPTRPSTSLVPILIYEVKLFEIFLFQALPSLPRSSAQCWLLKPTANPCQARRTTQGPVYRTFVMIGFFIWRILLFYDIL